MESPTVGILSKIAPYASQAPVASSSRVRRMQWKIDDGRAVAKLCQGGIEVRLGSFDDVRRLEQMLLHALQDLAVERDLGPVDFSGTANERLATIDDQAEGVASERLG